MSMSLLSMKALIALGAIAITYGATFTVNLATAPVGSLCCQYRQIPFSETGSILESITFSGVRQGKLCIYVLRLVSIEILVASLNSFRHI